MKEYVADFRKLQISIRKSISSSFLGNFKSAFRGNGLSFSEFRVRQDGDDASAIDWLVSAREGKILVRKMEEDREISVLFLLDVSESMKFGNSKSKLTLLLEIFYLLAYSAIQQGSNVGVILYGGEQLKFFNFSRFSGIFFQVYSYIMTNSKKTQKSATTFQDAFKLFHRLRFKKKLVFLLTDKENISDMHLKQMAFGNELNFIHILTHFENSLEEKTGIVKLSGEYVALDIDLGDKNKTLQFQKLRKESIEKMRKIIYSIGGFYLLVEDIDSLYAKLLVFMKEKNL